jgi:type IV secretion system protein VirB6
MACASAFGQTQFVAEIMRQVDCQARTLGANGFGALASPGSTATLVVQALLTIFIALYGFRLLLGHAVSGRDLVTDTLKVGIVLTLATSWPAWRILGYDLVVSAPMEIAETVGNASGLSVGNARLVTRLAQADQAIVGLTIYGSGRLTGGVSAGGDVGDSFQGVALADQTALGWGRLAFLVGVLAPLAGVKVTAGILLALTPLMAGLLLFGPTSAVFVGWLRGLAACAVAIIGLSLLYGVELALIEPWLVGVLAQRQDNVLAPSAPTELLVITLTFAIAAIVMLAILSRVAFFGRGFARPPIVVRSDPVMKPQALPLPLTASSQAASGADTLSRSVQLSHSIQASMRREAAAGNDTDPTRSRSAIEVRSNGQALQPTMRPPGLGESYRRTYRRTSSAATRRDRRP